MAAGTGRRSTWQGPLRLSAAYPSRGANRASRKAPYAVVLLGRRPGHPANGTAVVGLLREAVVASIWGGPSGQEASPARERNRRLVGRSRDARGSQHHADGRSEQESRTRQSIAHQA